jgi:hypothetical protein
MGMVDMDDVVGIWVEREAGNRIIVCQECATDEEWNSALEEDFITSQDIENTEKAYFCDRCQKRL